jgi:intein/homing endonuclease
MSVGKSEIDRISYLSNSYVRSSTRHLAKKLKPSSPLGNIILQYYVSLAPGYTPEDGAITAYLSGKNCSEAEIGLILAKKTLYATISKEGAKDLIRDFFRFYKRIKVLEATDVYQKNKVEDLEIAEDDFIEEMSRIHKISGSDFELMNLAEVNIKELIEKEISGEGAKIPSKFSIVRQSSAYKAYCKGWIVEICAPPGTGKQADVNSKILTETGFQRFGDLEVGDKVFSKDGTLTTVTGIFPQGIKASYKVTSIDGQEAYCGLEHLWHIKRKAHRGWLWETVELKEIIEKGLQRPNGEYKYYLPVNDAIQYSEKELLINPYILGILIAEGALSGDYGHQIIFSNPEADIISRMQDYLGENYTIKTENGVNKDLRWYISYYREKENPLKAEIKNLGLNVGSLDKFIPEIYMQSSIEQRKQLLAGLFDGDGNIAKGTSKLNYSTHSKRLAEDFLSLCRSLGYKARLSSYERKDEGKNTEYRVRILTNEKIWTSKKHDARYRTAAKAWTPKYDSTAIKSIEYVGEVEQQCISVSHPSHLYICDDYIVTHNTMFMLNEVVFMAQQGFRVVWAALGDMKPSDMLLRVSTIVNNITLDEAVADPEKYVTTPAVLEVFNNIHFAFYAAAEVSANELVNNILSIDPMIFDYQIVVIDYDDNLASEYDNMYMEGANAYAEFTRLSNKKDDYKLVFVGSQVKQDLWEEEILPERCVAQSSAKQARVDMMLCFNRNKRNPNIGTFNITKQRRGKLLKGKYRLDSFGHFHGINDIEYLELVNTRDNQSTPAQDE